MKSRINNIGNFFKNKLIQPLLGFLKQGMSPKKLAVTIALGLLIGILPVPGTTTILCAGIALILKLNMAAIQLINYFVYPLQFFMFVPFVSTGNYLLGTGKAVLSFQYISQLFQHDFFNTILEVSYIFVDGIIGWGIAFIPIYLLTYYLSYHLLLLANRKDSSA